MRLRPLLLVAVGLLAMIDRADAQPSVVQIAGETWKQSRTTTGDQLTRTDGTVVELTPSTVACSKQTRTAAAERYGWVPRSYWPTVDTASGKVVLCFEHGGGTALITVIPAAGKTVGGDVGPILDAIARQLRPPTDVPELGPMHTSIPVAMAVANVVTFVLDGTPVTVGVNLNENGSCAYENAMVVMQVGKLANRSFATGYWPTISDGKNEAVYGCLELRQGYVSVIVRPASQLAALGDVLQEVRRAAYARHGGPLMTDVDPFELPNTKQRVASKEKAGLWKVVDGTRFQRPGSDVLVSTAGLGLGSTMYSIVVGEGPCTVGTTPLAAGVAESLFPPQLGGVWIDPDEYALRWTAWACVTKGNESATISVMGQIASKEPPPPKDTAAIRAMIEQIARSYGVDIPDGTNNAAVNPTPAPYSPYRYRGSGGYGGFAGGYFGVISLAPEQGDRRHGGLVGMDMRFGATGFGGVFAFDLEVGYGGGEFIGELRLGGGVALGPLQLVVGGSVGSIGPAAALDGYAEASLAFQVGRSYLWLGAMRAKGVAGPDHDQLSAKLVITGKDESGIYLGARAMWFGADEDTLLENGTALLLTFGGGVASN